MSTYLTITPSVDHICDGTGFAMPAAVIEGGFASVRESVFARIRTAATKQLPGTQVWSPPT